MRRIVVGGAVLCAWLGSGAGAEKATPPAAKPATAPAAKPAAPKPAEPWLRAKPFETAAKDMLAAAAAAPAPPAGPRWFQALYEEERFTWGDDGAVTRVWYRVSRVPAEGESEYVGYARDGMTSITWAPWRQARPELRTRVIAPDGTVTMYEDAAAVEGAVDEEEEGEGPTARRSVHHPLGVLAGGTVVEQRSTVVGSRPLFEGDLSYEITMASWIVPLRQRIILDAPVSRRLAHEVGGMRIVPKIERAAGRQTITFERVAAEGSEPPREWSVPDDVVGPRLRFATDKSWSEIAAAYAKLLDERAAAGPVTATAEELGQGATDRARLIESIVVWFDERVKPTLVTFDDETPIPATPAEVLAAKQAGDIDAASTLCALLRKAGVEADVALVRDRGSGGDVSPKMPALGLFDRALVRVRGEPAVWLDPSVPFSGPNELGSEVKGRQALVIAAGTTGLTRTPDAAPADERLVETVDIELAEARGARVSVATERQGGDAGAYRASLHQDPKKTPQMVESEATYRLFGRLARFQDEGGAGLTGPVRYRYVVEGAERYFTNDYQVKVLVPDVTRELPWDLRTPARDGNGPAKRVHDYVFSRPFSQQTRMTIKVPPGFEIPALPASGQLPIGPLTLFREATVDDRVVTISQRLEIDHLRITAAEVEAVRAALAALDEESLELTFEITGMIAMRDGNATGALAEIDKLAKLHPKEALHHDQLADIYISVGMGAEARREAERGTTLEPKSLQAWSARAWVLEHDEIGRYLTRGYDRAGALAARKKAKALAPADQTWYAHRLADLLGRDAEGFQYTPASDRAAAAAELTASVSKSKDRDSELELAEILFWMGRLDEAVTLLRGFPPSEHRNVLLVASLVVIKGSADAVLELKGLPDTDDAARENVLQMAVGLLDRARRYSDAALLLRTAASRHPNAVRMNARAQTLSDRQRYDEDPPDKKSPTDAARRLALTLVAYAAGMPRHSWETAISRDALPQKTWRYIGATHRALEKIGWSFPTYGESHGNLLDASFTETSCREVSGDAETAWLVKCTDTGPFGFPVEAYFVLEDGAVAFLAWRHHPVPLGARAYRLLGQGKTDAARRLLDAALEEAGEAGDPAYLTGAFARVWTRGEERKDHIRVAAALLAAGLGDKKAVADAKKCGKVIGDTDACDAALVASLQDGRRFKDAVEPLDRLAKAHPDDRGLDGLRLAALAAAGRWSEVKDGAEALLAKDPAHEGARELLPYAIGATDLAAMRRWYLDRLGQKQDDAGLRNMAAWTAVAEGTVTSDDVSIAEVGLIFVEEWGRYGLLNTIAAARALSGTPSEAYRVLLRSLAAEYVVDPTPSDLFVHGLIAESLGLTAVAIEDYQRVKPVEGFHAVDTTAIAARRLEALTAKKKK